MRIEKGMIVALTILAVTGAYANNEKLRYVIDGDTVVFQSTTCRLAYIDTPESKFNKKLQRDIGKTKSVTADEVVRAGRISKNYLKSQMRKGKTYSFDVNTVDHYGRSVCVIYDDDGSSINDRIVRNGLAVPFWRYIPRKMQPKYRNMMMSAERENKGLWRVAPNVMNMMK